MTLASEGLGRGKWSDTRDRESFSGLSEDQISERDSLGISSLVFLCPVDVSPGVQPRAGLATTCKIWYVKYGKSSRR